MDCRGDDNGTIAVLGGGLAGLAVGYYAVKKNLPFRIFEAGNKTGGNCVTFQYDDFLFDSGAHRIHDKVPDVTKEFKNIFGDELSAIVAPSQIYHNGRFIHFPLSPFNILKSLGFFDSSRALFELMLSRIKKKPSTRSFETFALENYGATISERFLLSYSEKLWGIPCKRLSPHVAGKRLKGLDVKSLFMESIFGRKNRIPHVEGAFYYPSMGIGAIADRLEELCGKDNIRKNSRISRIFHDQSRILAIEVNNNEKIHVRDIISTLPLNFFIQKMEPSPPREILDMARHLAFRKLILVAFFLNKNLITPNASVYFPDRSIPFTRIYEPKNRSKLMSPLGKTSLIVEIPSNGSDELWNMEDDRLIPMILSHIVRIGWIQELDIIGTVVKRLDFAYPVLDIDHLDNVEKIHAWLECFANLKTSGRNGRFVYAWIHDMMRFGRDIIDEYDSIRNEKYQSIRDK